MNKLKNDFLGVSAAFMLMFAGNVLADTYPSKPVRIIVPYAAGGSTDITARLIAQGLTIRLGQPFLVENRVGAGGTIGHELVAKAPSDGYTLLVSATGPLTVTPHTYTKLNYEPIKSFTPIKLLATTPLLFVINPKLPVESVADIIRLAKEKPRGMTYGSFGNGSTAHLVAEHFKSLANIDIVHIPYNGSAPALNDLLGGQIDMMFDIIVTALPHVKTGKLRALAITSDKRSDLQPDIPTMQQAGVKDFEATAWFGLLAPAGVDKQVVETLSKNLEVLLQQPEVREKMMLQGATVAQSTPESFGQFFQSEYDKWGKVVRSAKMKVD